MPNHYNKFQLQEGTQPVDENLRPIKIGGKATAIETAQNGDGARVTGDLEVTGKIPIVKTNRIASTSSTPLEIKLDDNSVRIIPGETDAYFLLGLYENPSILLVNDDGDQFSITVDADGKTTLSTADAGGEEADLVFNIDGYIDLNSASGEKIILDSGADIDLDAQSGGDVNIPADIGLTFGDDGEKIEGDGTDLTIASSNIATIDTGGKIVLDSASGGFEMLGAGSTAKFADMYAGMILGYTAIGIDATADSYAVGGAFVITDADHKVTFVAPPSGKVEIEINISVISISVRWLVLCLADSVLASPIDFPNSNDVTNEHRVGDIQVEGYARVLNHKWVVEGLTAGTEYTWYLSAKAEQAGRITLWWGGDATNAYEPFIMKATALPATIYTG